MHGIGVIPTDAILLNGQRYNVADGIVVERRLFPEQEAGAVFDRRGEEGPTYGDLHPAIQTFVIEDFALGSGLWVDHGKKFSRRAWKSTLDHANEGLLILGPRRQASGTIPRVNWYVHYRNAVYALTNSGLYLYNQATNTLGAVAGTPTTPMYHACIHNEFLVLAGSSANAIRLFDGTNFTTPSGQTAHLVESLDGRLFAVEPVGVNGLIKVRYSENNGSTWLPAIVAPSGAEGGLPTPNLDPRMSCIAPDGDGLLQLHVATPSGVWIVDYRTGLAALLHDMSHNVYTGNGYMLTFWPSTRKIYVNERTTIVEINPETGEAKPVGPDFRAGEPPGVPSGFPDDFRPDYISTFSHNPNYLFIGTHPKDASNYALVMKMDVEGHWFFVTRVYNAEMQIRAMLYGGPSLDAKLYFAEDEPATTNSLTKFLETDGDYAEEGEIETPWLSFGFPDIEKCFFDIVTEADSLSATETVQVAYRKDYNDGVDYTLTALTGATVRPYRQTIGTYPSAVGDEFQAIKFIIKLDRDDATPLVTPRWFRMTVRFRLHPPPLYAYDVNLLIDKTENPNYPYADIGATLKTALEETCAVPFVASGDTAETAIPVIPLLDVNSIKYEQQRRAYIVKLTLVVAAFSTASNPTTHLHTMDSFLPDGATALFTLLNVPITGPIVFLDDTYQVEGAAYDYTRSGQALTFLTNPGAGTTLRVHYGYLG